MKTYLCGWRIKGHQISPTCYTATLYSLWRSWLPFSPVEPSAKPSSAKSVTDALSFAEQDMQLRIEANERTGRFPKYQGLRNYYVRGIHIDPGFRGGI